MVKLTIETVDPKVPVKLVHASRNKQTRAEPVASLFEHGRGHMLGSYPALEDELCLWRPGDDSPNRLDAMVWGFTELLLEPAKGTFKQTVGRPF
jgi:phage terminase large subunit-like protein